MNILIHRHLPDDVKHATELSFPGHSFRWVNPAEPIAEELSWAEILVGNPDDTLSPLALSHLKWIQLLSSGCDAFAHLAGLPAKITSAHGIHAAAAAQHLLMMILMLERRQGHFIQAQQEHRWDRQARLPGLLHGQTLLLIGFGSIARKLAELLAPFQVNIRAVHRNVPQAPGGSPVHVHMSALDAELAEADHIVVTLPLTTETHGLLNARRIQAMRQGTCLHNVGRGPLVDEDALASALASGHLGGASLDVFENEPLPASSPLWDLPNCHVTPHIAGHHSRLDVDLIKQFSENLKRFDDGQPLFNEARFDRKD